MFKSLVLSPELSLYHLGQRSRKNIAFGEFLDNLLNIDSILASLKNDKAFPKIFKYSRLLLIF